MEWQPIETAPKDGTPVRVRRVYQGRVVKDGMAVWVEFHKDAPSRSPMEPDPLGRMSLDDYAREAEEWESFVNRPRWLTEDRMYAFPEPTEWLPDPVQEG